MTPIRELPARDRPGRRDTFPRPGLGCVFLFLLLLGAGFTTPLRAAEPAEALELIRTGNYSDAIQLATTGTSENPRNEDWPHILAQALLTVGRYPEARSVLTNALDSNPRSLRLRWLGREACLASGDTHQARQFLDEIRSLVSADAVSFRDPRNIVALAQAALELGSDPKIILERVLEPARKANPTLVETYLARGALALEKHDYALAGRAYAEGLKLHPGNPDLHYGQARAHLEGDRAVLVESLESALRINPRHLPSLLLYADHRIDAEDYTGATETLGEILAVNPHHPEAWALRAVLAHLKHDNTAEAEARTNALRFWPTNPRVDHLIGLKLSRKYRFAEGAAFQRQALAFDPAYLPAKAQLATDLLRLGEEEEGWRLAQEVNRQDGYDVTAYNLVTLRDTLKAYTTLTNEHFILRLSSAEAAVYGPRVLELLERAHQRLTTRYGVALQEPTLVEVFAEQKDFGVRTFGMPDNPGFLGVCFGRVITANGPAATRGRDSNWEAVLWHEFAHVVTLQLTANRMPRWLSEGISVYEEIEANPAWGQRFNPRYRSMIVGGELTPVSELSSAFLTPKSPFHLQFAYFQAYLVVDFLTRRFGIETVRSLLHDLRDGREINVALAARTLPIKELEQEFALFATERARGVGPGLDWEKPPAPKPGTDPMRSIADWAASRPTNFYALTQAAQRAIAAKDWAAALPPLQKLVELFPEQAGADSAYPLLAQVHRALDDIDAERRVLSTFAAQDHESPDAYLRLMELAAAAEDWPDVLLNARRYLAVNPLVAPPYRYLAQASEASGKPAEAIDAFQALLQLDTSNPANSHYQLARLLHPTDPQQARRHVLQALEEAPRHRAALQLLLQLHARANASNPTQTTP